MINLPYLPPFIDFEPSKSAEAMTEEEWDIFYDEHEARGHDFVLEQLVSDVSQLADYCAVCLITSGAHGYLYQNIAIQIQGTVYIQQAWESMNGTVTELTEQHLPLDLTREFHALYGDGIILRGSGNNNHDIITGLENRISTVYIAAGQNKEWYYYPRPLLNGIHRNNAANRIFLQLLGLTDQVTLQ